jgi:hypothetical protein
MAKLELQKQMLEKLTKLRDWLELNRSKSLAEAAYAKTYLLMDLPIDDIKRYRAQGWLALEAEAANPKSDILLHVDIPTPVGRVFYRRSEWTADIDFRKIYPDLFTMLEADFVCTDLELGQIVFAAVYKDERKKKICDDAAMDAVEALKGDRAKARNSGGGATGEGAEAEAYWRKSQGANAASGEADQSPQKALSGSSVPIRQPGGIDRR